LVLGRIHVELREQLEPNSAKAFLPIPTKQFLTYEY
jgi:hypothetical protein